MQSLLSLKWAIDQVSSSRGSDAIPNSPTPLYALFIITTEDKLKNTNITNRDGNAAYSEILMHTAIWVYAGYFE